MAPSFLEPNFPGYLTQCGLQPFSGSQASLEHVRTGSSLGLHRPGGCQHCSQESGELCVRTGISALTRQGRVIPPWMRPFMPLVQGSYFFLQKWWSNVNFHGLFIARPYREKKEVIKRRFYQIFVSKALIVWAKRKESPCLSCFCLDSPTKEGSVLQIQIVRLFACWQKEWILRPTSNKPFWTEIYCGGWLYLLTCQHFHNNFILLCGGNSRFTAASGFMRFQFYVNDLEKWENSNQCHFWWQHQSSGYSPYCVNTT